MRRLPILLVAAAVLGSPVVGRATVQEMDRVRFEGRDQFMMECPLNQLLARLPDPPEFGWQRTSNWKGYTARWEVRDGALFLVSFKADRKDKAVPLEAILPGRKLPTRADWYTGRVRIPIGEPIEPSPDGVYRAVYERVVDLRIEKGRVVKADERRKFRIPSPSEERDAERARRRLWTFPRLEAGTVQVRSRPVRDKLYFINLPPAALRRTPAWKDTPDPPLSPLKAMLRAEARSRELVPPGAKFTWELHKVCLKEWAEDRYYYEFVFAPHPREAVSARDPPYLTLLVLMDGTVPEPDVWDIAALIRATYAGAFDVEEPTREDRLAPWEDPDLGGPWSELSWRARLYLLGAIVAAPKLLYEIEKVEVYPNGVWAEYAVTNGGRRRMLVAPDRLHAPVRAAGLWDAAGGRWHVPPRRDARPAPAGRPDPIPLEPGQVVRFRVLVSTRNDRPLEPFGPVEGGPPTRPTALEYFTARWPRARLGSAAAGGPEAQVFAFGYGRVRVTWSEKPYPAEWAVQSRSAEGRGAK